MRTSFSLLALSVSVAAAQAPTLPLGPRTGLARETFDDIIGMAELDDGRVIVSDRVDHAYYIVDLTSGARRTIGHNGSGPNEYSAAFGPIRWRGDTLIGFDPPNHRYTLMLQDGSVKATIPFPACKGDEGCGWSVPKASDASGRIYYDLAILARKPVIKRTMEGQIFSWMPRSDAVETPLRYVDHAEFEHRFVYRPFPQMDAWVVAPDGRIGVLSAAEYRLRWYRDGKVVETGAPIAYEPVRITSAERDAFRAKKAEGPVGGSMNGQATSASIGAAKALEFWPDTLFPPRLPPFESEGGVLLAPNGSLWVKRTSPASDPAMQIDILDQHGVLRGVMKLPAGRRLLGIGAKSIYLIAKDADGLQTLERYAMPAVPR